jgi:endonuclease III
MMPEPKGELDYTNPFTLLVAVVLSAQATDAGVNKATPALFASPTRRRRWWRSARTGRDLIIRTIGLFRTKAKNVVALSRSSSRVRRQGAGDARGAGDAARRRPQDRQRRLNIAFGQPTIAVDTHIFRVANRTGMAPGQATRWRSRLKLWKRRARPNTGARASLADPARPLCVQGAQAA